MPAATLLHYCPCCPISHQGVYERCMICINNGFMTTADRRLFLDAGGEEIVKFPARVHECSACGKVQKSKYWGVCPCSEPIYNPETSPNIPGGTKFESA